MVFKVAMLQQNESVALRDRENNMLCATVLQCWIKMFRAFGRTGLLLRRLRSTQQVLVHIYDPSRQGLVNNDIYNFRHDIAPNRDVTISQ